jgi:signal transduction histidine kinase
LGTILMQAALLRRPAAEPERRSQRPAEVIERAATCMTRLIQDLLDVARLAAGQLSVEQVRVSTRDVVSEAVEAQKTLTASAGLELRAEVAPNVPDVWADRDRLLQAFANLIGNAIKFTEHGGRIAVGALPRDGEVLFWVADTGAGIAIADIPHAFDRFWQARKAGRSGAGLGLSIVKGIVEAHGGRIWVESTPGRGSTFFFTIPTAPPAGGGRGEPLPQRG